MKNHRSIAPDSPDCNSPEADEPLVQHKQIPLQQAEENYDYYQVPADINRAKKHGRAKRVYCDSHDVDDTEMCACCGFKKGKLLPLKAPLTDLYHLGSGYPLYFRFIKYATGMLGAMFVVSGLYNLISNVAEGDCTSQEEANEQTYCVKGYILSFALPNKKDDKKLLTAQLVLNFLTVIAIMIFFHLLRYRFRKMKSDADQKTVTPSDYTLEIRNVPLEASTEDVGKWIKEIASDEPNLKIERIIRIYAIHDYLKLFKLKSALKVKKNRLDALNDPDQEEERRRVSQQVDEVDAKMDNLKDPANKMVNIEKCPIVFVTFETSQQAALVKSKFKQSSFLNLLCLSPKKENHEDESPKYEGHEMIVKRAPEPTDIMWKNLQYEQGEKTKIRWMTYAITGLIIIVSFGIILLVNWAQGKAVVRFGEDSSVVQGLSIVSSLVVFATNSFLSFMIEKIAKYEKHTTHTHYLRGIAEKLAIAQFLNTAFTNLIAEVILANNNVEDPDKLGYLNFYGKGGLLENMYWVFITNAFLSPILTVLDPSYLWTNVQRKLAERKGDKNQLTQMEANVLYEGVTFDMPKKYAGLIKIVLLTAFYAPAMPFVLIFTIFGLTLWFWADKYMLLKHMSLPKSIDDDLTEAMVEYLEWAACTFAVGSIMFAYTMKDETGELAFIDTARALLWLALAVSLFHIFFPMDMLNKKLFKVKNQACENQTFEEARLSFTSDYDIENPITRKQAFRKHLMRKHNNSPSNKKYQNNFQSKEDDFDFDALENYARRDQENEYKGSGAGQDPGLKGVYKKLDQLINAEEVDLNNLFENIFGLDLDDILNDTPKNSQTPIQINPFLEALLVKNQISAKMTFFLPQCFKFHRELFFIFSSQRSRFSLNLMFPWTSKIMSTVVRTSMGHSYFPETIEICGPSHIFRSERVKGIKKASVDETHEEKVGPNFLAGIFGGIAGGIVGGLGLIKLQGKGKAEQLNPKKDHRVKWTDILGNLNTTLGLAKKNDEGAQEPAQEQAKGESTQTPLDKSVDTNATRRAKSGQQDSISSSVALINQEKEKDDEKKPESE